MALVSRDEAASHFQQFDSDRDGQVRAASCRLLRSYAYRSIKSNSPVCIIRRAGGTRGTKQGRRSSGRRPRNTADGRAGGERRGAVSQMAAHELRTLLEAATAATGAGAGAAAAGGARGGLGSAWEEGLGVVAVLAVAVLAAAFYYYSEGDRVAAEREAVLLLKIRGVEDEVAAANRRIEQQQLLHTTKNIHLQMQLQREREQLQRQLRELQAELSKLNPAPAPAP